MWLMSLKSTIILIEWGIRLYYLIFMKLSNVIGKMQNIYMLIPDYQMQTNFTLIQPNAGLNA